MSIFDEKYIKAKVREFNGVLKQIFQTIKYQKKTNIILTLPV